MGFLGKENPSIFEKCFWNYSIENGFLFVSGSTRTNIKITEPDGRLTELNEPGFIISKADQERLLEQVYRRADKYTLFVLSGSLPKGADPDLYAKIIIRIHNKGGSVILDTDQEGFAQAMELTDAKKWYERSDRRNIETVLKESTPADCVIRFGRGTASHQNQGGYDNRL